MAKAKCIEWLQYHFAANRIFTTKTAKYVIYILAGQLTVPGLVSLLLLLSGKISRRVNP